MCFYGSQCAAIVELIVENVHHLVSTFCQFQLSVSFDFYVNFEAVTRYESDIP